MPGVAFSDSSFLAPTVRRLLDGGWPEVRDASLAVDSRDDMFAFGVAATGDLPLAVMAYFRAGASMLDVVEAVADWHFGGIARVGSFLDFAGGYGRSTRFFATRLGPERVTVAEVQSDALSFQAREFKVGTLLSSTDPAALDTRARGYSFVFVASLFSHLPRDTFTRWLARLWELVEPGGVLVFSVHDEVLEDHGAQWEDGHAFLPASEISDLDTADYGTAFTTERFVREQLSIAVGEMASGAVRLPRALCFHQDVWVVPKGPAQPGPLAYECGPQGALDLCLVDGDMVSLSGWSADTGDAVPGAEAHPIDRIELSFSDGTRALARHGHPRPDVAMHLGRVGDPDFEHAGWTAEVRLSRNARPGDIVTVVSTCAHGRSYVLDAARLDDATARMGREPMRVGPLQRRLRTAQLVYRTEGAGGLIRLIPAVVRSERARLRRTLRASALRR